MTTTTIVQPSWQLQRNSFGRLVLTDVDGVAHENVIPVRAFPVSAPDHGLSLVSSDGHELAWIDTLDELDYYRNGGILHYVLRKLAA